MIEGSPKRWRLDIVQMCPIYVMSVSVGKNEEQQETTPSPPTKSSGFKGFDSSRLLILRGGNSHVR